MTLLVATTNPGKLSEIRPLFEDLPIDLVTLADLPAIEAPQETGRTFMEIARLKAQYYAAATGLLTVAEDSGLEIDALGGAPGVESARFGGVESSYDHKFELIYEGLAARGNPDRTARFVCAVALAEGAEIRFEALGNVEGTIAAAPTGRGGFGYDPIFYYPPYGSTLAEVDGAKKAAVSHRGNAFRQLRNWLEASNLP